MKDEFVSFETAKLAKKRGYPQNTFGTTDMQGACYIDDGRFYPNGCIYPTDRAQTAPTQSMLQRWFREEKKLSIEICYNGLSRSFSWACVDMDKGFFAGVGVKDFYMQDYSTYEEALEDALWYNLKNNSKFWNNETKKDNG